VFALGNAIASSIPGNQYERRKGTSQSAPFVTGVAALYLQLNRAATPANVAVAIQNAAARDVLKNTSAAPLNAVNFALQIVAVPESFHQNTAIAFDSLSSSTFIFL
jgi:subtilisin family serine protease